MIAATPAVSVAELDELDPSLGVAVGSLEAPVAPVVGSADPETVGAAAADTSYRPISAPATPTAKAATTPSATNRPVRRRRRGGGGGAGWVSVYGLPYGDPTPPAHACGGVGGGHPPELGGS